MRVFAPAVRIPVYGSTEKKVTVHGANMPLGGILKAEGFGDGKYQSWEKHPQAALEAGTPANGYKKSWQVWR